MVARIFRRPDGRRRHRPVLLVLTAAVSVALPACSFVDQGALTLDAETGRPALVLALCDDEKVQTVELTAATPDDDDVYQEGATLWRIEAAAPQRRTRFVVGEVPPGFRQRVAFEGNPLPDELVLTADTTRDTGRHGGHAVLAELAPGVLLSGGSVVTAEELRDTAQFGCWTADPWRALVPPAWVLWVWGSVLLATALWGVWFVRWTARRDARRRLA